MNIDGSELPKNADALYEYFQNGDSVSFVIKRKQARYFRKQIDRVNQTEIYLRKRHGLFSKIRSILYMLYVIVLNFWLTVQHKELERPLLVYTTFWRYIASFGGEDLSSGMAKITFYGKEIKNKAKMYI